MNTRVPTWAALLLLIGLLFSSGARASSEESDEMAGFPVEAYQQLLDDVLVDGLVRYSVLARDREARLAPLVAAIAEADPAAVKALPKAAHDAWHINAYNILTLDMIARNYPVASIRELPAPWKQPFTVAGEMISLDHIEHEILRRQNAPAAERAEHVDARLHFVINCASIGCPPLPPVALTGENLEEQYELGARRFANDRRHMRVRDETWQLSELLNWFGEDFRLGHPGLTRDQALARFFAERVEAPATAEAIRTGNLRIVWLEYDWALNDTGR